MSKQRANPKHSDLSKCGHQHQFLLEEILIQRRIWFPPVLTSAGLWHSDDQMAFRMADQREDFPGSSARQGMYEWMDQHNILNLFNGIRNGFQESHVSGICKYCGI